MPRISSFYGIVVAMYYRDHSPAHFHARYAEHELTLEIATLASVEGWLPQRALRLVREWAELHRNELAENWIRAREREPLKKIEPLP